MKKNSSPGSKAGGPASVNGPVKLLTDGWQQPRPIDLLLKGTELPSKLSADEARDLQECEAVIERGWHTFLAVGRALFKIRENGLYRDRYKTWEDYCRHRWEFSKTHANRLVGAAQVVDALTPIGVKCERESQLRPLVPLIELGPEKVQVAWQEAEKLAGEGRLTAKHVQQAATEFLPKHKRKPKQDQATNGATRKKALLVLVGQAEEAAKDRDFKAVLRVLDKLKTLARC